MKQLFDLFATFFRIGLFTFGGGYAMLPLIQELCVDRKRWLTPEELMSVTVIAESTPGPVAINCSTYVGWKQKGFPGALAATLGVVLPSFVILYVISQFLDRFLRITWVANAFRGIQVAVALLIGSVGLRMFRNLKQDLLTRVLFTAAFCAMLAIDLLSLRLSAIVLLLFGGGVGVCVWLCRKGKNGGDGL